MPRLAIRGFCAIGLLLLIIGSAGVAGAQDEQNVKRLQKLIEQQQKQLEAQQKALEAQAKALEDLKSRVEAMSKDGASEKKDTVEAEKLAEKAVKKAQAAKEAAAKVHREALAVKVMEEEDRQRLKGLSFTIPSTKTVMTISGFVQADLIRDFDKIASPTGFITKDIVVNGQPEGQPNGRTTFSANTSRFVIASGTPTRYGKLSTFISMDFLGNSKSSSPDPRLRQAWGQLDEFFFGGALRAGQSWTTWDDVPALPETLDFEGPNASQELRQPLIRWSRDFQDQYTLWIGVESPDYNIGNADTKTAMPDIIASFNWHGDWGHIKPAFVGRQLKGKSDSGRNDSAFGWGVQLAGIVNVPWPAKKDNFRFQTVYGAGIGSYNNDGGIADGWFDGSDNLKAIQTFQGYGAFQHWWIDSLRSNAVFGYVYADLRKTQPEDALQQTMYFAGNLIWSPIEQMDIGAEFLWGQRENNNDAIGSARRIQFSTKYAF